MEPMQLRDPLQLRLVFAANVPAMQLDAALAEYEEALRQRLADYRARLENDSIFVLARSAREDLIWRLSIENGIAWCDAQLKWLRSARGRLAAVPKHTEASARRPKRSR